MELPPGPNTPHLAVVYYAWRQEGGHRSDETWESKNKLCSITCHGYMCNGWDDSLYVEEKYIMGKDQQKVIIFALLSG